MKVKKFKIVLRILSFIIIMFWVIFLISIATSLILRKYAYPLNYKEEIIYYADYYGLDRALVFAIVKTESDFDSTAISRAGAVGLMQIMPKTAQYIAEKLNATDFDLTVPDTNLNFGCYYFKYLLNRFKDSFTAHAAYNAGEGNVMLWLDDKTYSQNGLTLTTTPFNETNAYCKKINKSFAKYKKLYSYILDK